MTFKFANVFSNENRLVNITSTIEPANSSLNSAVYFAFANVAKNSEYFTSFGCGHIALHPVVFLRQNSFF